MASFKVGNHEYKSAKLSAFQQFHIARRVAPVFSSFGEAFKAFEASKNAPGAAKDEAGNPVGNPLVVLEPVSAALAKMTDAEAEYVLNACLGAVEVFQQAGNSNNGIWAPIRSAGGIMFPLELPELLQIAWNVLQENFASFFANLPGVSSVKFPAATAANPAQPTGI